MIDKTRYPEVIALAFTAAIVAFVGAIVVLTIPYAIFTIPLPASVNLTGLSVEAPQHPFFGLLLYLLVPSGLFALWVGYKFYRWGCKNTETSRGDQTQID